MELPVRRDHHRHPPVEQIPRGRLIDLWPMRLVVNDRRSRPASSTGSSQVAFDRMLEQPDIAAVSCVGTPNCGLFSAIGSVIDGSVL